MLHQEKIWEYFKNKVIRFVHKKEKRKEPGNTDQRDFGEICRSNALNPEARRYLTSAKIVIEGIRDAHNLTEQTALKRISLFVRQAKDYVKNYSWYHMFAFSGNWWMHYKNDYYIEEFLEFMVDALSGIDLKYSNPETINLSDDEDENHLPPPPNPHPLLGSNLQHQKGKSPLSVVVKGEIKEAPKASPSQAHVALPKPSTHVPKKPKLVPLAKFKEAIRKLAKSKEGTVPKSELDAFEKRLQEAYVPKKDYESLLAEYRQLEADFYNLASKCEADIELSYYEEDSDDEKYAEKAGDILLKTMSGNPVSAQQSQLFKPAVGGLKRVELSAGTDDDATSEYSDSGVRAIV